MSNLLMCQKACCVIVCAVVDYVVCVCAQAALCGSVRAVGFAFFSHTCCRLTWLFFSFWLVRTMTAAVLTAPSPLSVVLLLLLAVERVLSDCYVIELALRVRVSVERKLSELALTPTHTASAPVPTHLPTSACACC